MTLCEICGENEATTQLVRIVQGTKITQRLCESCLEGEGLGLVHPFTPKLNTVHNFLDALMKPAPGMQASSPFAFSPGEAALQHFQSTGKFGHPDDYKLLQKYIGPFLQKIHGSVKHRGKVPQMHKTREQEIAELIDQMNEAAATERYEDAAKLRDRIRSLKPK